MVITSKFKFGNLQFYDYRFRMGSIEGFALPIDIIVLFQETLMKKNRSKGEDVIYRSSYEGFKEIFNKLPKKGKENMNYMNNILNNLSVGQFIFSRFDIKNKVIMIKNSNNPLAERYKALYGLQKKGIDSYILGILVAASEVLLGEYGLRGKEIYCKAQGKPSCLFEIRK